MSESGLRPVRRCVCAAVSFAEMKLSGAKTLDEINHRFDAGINCGLCVPYIQRMLETGEVEFDASSISYSCEAG